MQRVRTSLPAEPRTPGSTGNDGVDREVALGPAKALARRKRCVVTVDDLALLVVFHRRRFAVMRNRCPHLGAELDGARIFGRSTPTGTHSSTAGCTQGSQKVRLGDQGTSRDPAIG
jgi:hypothetical protein